MCEKILYIYTVEGFYGKMVTNKKDENIIYKHCCVNAYSDIRWPALQVSTSGINYTNIQCDMHNILKRTSPSEARSTVHVVTCVSLV